MFEEPSINGPREVKDTPAPAGTGTAAMQADESMTLAQSGKEAAEVYFLPDIEGEVRPNAPTGRAKSVQGKTVTADGASCGGDKGRAELGSLLNRIEQDGENLERQYRQVLRQDQTLTRKLVSFQANKSRSIYRWYKYKEGFSAELVEYFLTRYDIPKGRVLDPFAGSGTTLFAATALGFDAEGVELLPIGQAIIDTKQRIDEGLTSNHLAILAQWANCSPWDRIIASEPIPELRITRGAYPQDTAAEMSRYLAHVNNESDPVRSILRFALLCILESISYTRKDGQYLRWDHRAGRQRGLKQFDKGRIVPFKEAIQAKLREIVSDLTLPASQPDLFYEEEPDKGAIVLHRGSCLEILPSVPAKSHDCIITSPPYCNRYDYTRTYALELALLGVTEKALSEYRQSMLSCTVENRAKDLIGMCDAWKLPISCAESHELLSTIVAFLNLQGELGLLNNSGIPRMIKGYFYEMACVVYECHRILKPGGVLIMVNDNVRYAGVSIPVDLILSDFARTLGFAVESILVLPDGKGNSSQQMGAHGRDSLRKCVYVWRVLE